MFLFRIKSLILKMEKKLKKFVFEREGDVKKFGNLEVEGNLDFEF